MRAYRTKKLPRWDLAAVVVAIIAVPLAMSPAASSFIRDLCFVLLRTMWPSSAQYEQLGWDDIKKGCYIDAGARRKIVTILEHGVQLRAAT